MLRKLEKWLYTPKQVQLLRPIRYVKDKSLKPWLIQIFFVLISLIFALSFLFNKGLFGSDEIFHIYRLKEVGQALIHGHWSQFNIYTGSPEGNAINTFYPYLLLIPLALLSLIITPMKFIGISIGLIVFIGLETCYIAFRKVLRYANLASFVIAVCFWLSTAMMSTTLKNVDVGTAVANIFIPIVFIGWIKWMQNNRWKMLVIGLLGILYSSIPSFIVILVILSILTILQCKLIDIVKIKIIVKAICIFLLCSMIYTIPVVALQATNKIYYPDSVDIKNNSDSLTIPTTMSKICTPSGYMVCDILELVIIFMMIIYWKHLKNFVKQLGILSVVLILVNIKTINDILIKYTFLHALQSCSRFTMISNFMLCLVAVNILDYIFKHSNRCDLWQGIIYFILLIHAFWIMIIPININMTNYKYPSLTHKEYITSITHTSHSNIYTQYRYRRILNVFNKNTSHTIETPLDYPDYLPLQTIRLRNNCFNYSTRVYYANGFNFNHVREAQNIKIPLVQYHTQRYIIKNNNKPIKVQYDKHFTKIKLHKGNNKIRVVTPVMWYRYIGLIGTIIGIVGLYYKPRKDKND